MAVCLQSLSTIITELILKCLKTLSMTEDTVKQILLDNMKFILLLINVHSQDKLKLSQKSIMVYFENKF